LGMGTHEGQLEQGENEPKTPSKSHFGFLFL
jgi:hypothetical protein